MKRVAFAAVFMLHGLPVAASEPDWASYAAGLPDCYYGAQGEAEKLDCISRFADLCMEQAEGGQTTLGMTSCATAERDAWDALLNVEYREAVATARGMDAGRKADFPEFAVLEENLRQAQRAWIAFRDAECALRYSVWGEGSMRNIEAAFCQLRMTAERTVELGGLFDFEN